jgi:hypothetical protein
LGEYQEKNNSFSCIIHVLFMGFKKIDNRGSRPATNDPMSSTGNVHKNLMNFNFGRIKPRSEPGSWKGCGAISPPDPWNRFKAKPTGITIVNTERFDRLGLYISSAPVEEKGYKRIIKLPD